MPIDNGISPAFGEDPRFDDTSRILRLARYRLINGTRKMKEYNSLLAAYATRSSKGLRKIKTRASVNTANPAARLKCSL